VGHLDDVAAEITDHRRDDAEEARPIVADDPQRHQPRLAHQLAGQDRGEQAGVDIAAGEDQPDLLAAESFRIGQQRRQGGGTSPLGHGLFHIAVEGDGALEEGLLDQQDVVDQRPGDGVAQVADLFHRDALGDGLAGIGGVDAAHAGGEGGKAGRLDADDADIRLHMLGRCRHTRDQAATADGHGQDFEIGRVLEHLQGDGALAGHDVDVVEGVDEDEVALGAEGHGLSLRVVIAVALDHHLSAEFPGLLHLHEGGVARHDDGHRDTQALCVVGEALAVVAGRGRDHPAPALVRRQLEELVEGAPLLVGGGELQVLELHPHLGARNLRQGLGMAAGSAFDLAVDPRGGGFDIGESQGHGMREPGEEKRGNLVRLEEKGKCDLRGGLAPGCEPLHRRRSTGFACDAGSA